MIQRLTRSTDDAGLTAAPMGEQELMMDTVEGERLRRWRLVLGEEAQASCGLAGLSPEDRQMDVVEKYIALLILMMMVKVLFEMR